MAGTGSDSKSWDVVDEAATWALAGAIARIVRVGDVIALSGGLGAGKTSFARGFLRARSGDPSLEVPSPTFTLVQIYDLPGGAVWHLDLFRLERATDIWELGIEEGMASAIVLIEWPERMTSFLPPDRLAIEFASGAREDSRRIRLIAHGGWRERFAEIAGDV